MDWRTTTLVVPRQAGCPGRNKISSMKNKYVSPRSFVDSRPVLIICQTISMVSERYFTLRCSRMRVETVCLVVTTVHYRPSTELVLVFNPVTYPWPHVRLRPHTEIP